MKTQLNQLAGISMLPAVLFTLASCDVKKTQEGKMPKVEVTEEGQMPKYDVDAPDVDVTTEKKEIEVPKIEVTPPDQDND